MILTPGRLPARQAPWEPEMGANVFIRLPPQRDLARIFLQVKGSPLDRLSPTVTDTLEFPDTEEVTGSNPVRPTMTGLLQPVTPPVPAGRARFHDQLQQVRSEEIPRQNFIFGAYCQRKLNSLLNATRTAIATADPIGPNHRDQVH